MSSSRKKVILRKLTRDWVAGYLPADGFTRQGNIELLELSGKVLSFPIQQVKWICFVRDFNSGEVNNPERLLRKSFAGRPRGEGLWLRLQFQDGDALEGLVENNIGLLDAEGFFLIPPDIRGNTQRLWIPRTTLTGLEVAAVIGGTAKKKPSVAEKPEQESLFPLIKN
ncbi:MAG TPA: hypothetical protein VHT24_06680 [Pseudacidobacterium sp.]|jgi:hypothetical protein|nr:hypothetical protein [Pseudacidobacterium sp.]